MHAAPWLIYDREFEDSERDRQEIKMVGDLRSQTPNTALIRLVLPITV